MIINRDNLLSECEALAERLVAIGDMDSFEQIFGSRDPNFKLATLPTEQLQNIYDEDIKEG